MQTLRVLFEESGRAFAVPLAQKVRLEHRVVGERRLKPAGSRLRSDWSQVCLEKAKTEGSSS
jgi:hypothetical protein